MLVKFLLRCIIVLFSIVGTSLHVVAQLDATTINDLQKKHKDSEAYITSTNETYTFKANPVEKIVEVKAEKTKELVSLRYNESIPLIEVYDQNSSILKFYGESSLKQRLVNESKFCGTFTQEGYFYDDSKFCSHTLKLKELGEKWTINSIKKINDSRYFTSAYFEDEYPIKEKKVRFRIPSNVVVELREFNFEGFEISKNTFQEGTDKIIEYTAKNLLGTINERYSRGAQYYRPHILVLVKSIETGSEKIPILSSTADLYNWYHSLIEQLTPKPEIFKTHVETLIKDKTNDEEKIQSIYYWVQDNIRYIAFENGIAGFKPDNAQNVYEKKYGDCKGMANLLKEMLKVAGYDARITWIGTKQIRYDYSIPSLAVDNHMICTVLLGDKKYFLDATEKYNPLGENAERLQGREVLIEDGKKFILHKIPEEDKEKDLELKKFNLSLAGEKLEGNCEMFFHGETRKNFLYSYNYTKIEDRKKYIENQFSEGNSNIKLSELVVPDLSDRKKTISIKSKASLNNLISKFNNEVYLEADPIKDFQLWELKDERQSDLDFGKKVNNKLEVEIEIPSEYKITTVPENLSINEEEFIFNLTYTVEGNKIKYKKEISIKKGIVTKKSFKNWNAAIKKLSNAYTSPIILNKQ